MSVVPLFLWCLFVNRPLQYWFFSHYIIKEQDIKRFDCTLDLMERQRGGQEIVAITKIWGDYVSLYGGLNCMDLLVLIPMA